MKKVLSLPTPSHIQRMFRAADWEALKTEFDVTENHTELIPSADEVREKLADYDAVLTAWGSPAFSRPTLESAPHLKLVAHTAGSVKGLFSAEVVKDVLIPRGLTVYSGNTPMAINVAEATIGLMISIPRRWPQLQREFQQTRGGVQTPTNGQFLTGTTVGIISASQVARYTLKLLTPFGCRVLLYDPFVTAAHADELGVELVGLDEIFAQIDILSVHAPALPSTKNMIGARHLSLLRDGATFINTARGAVVDHEALLKECRTGRILAALDVTEPEPLPRDSEFWELPNVYLLPHVTGTGHAGFFGIGAQTLQALRDVFVGKPVQGAVPLEGWESLA